MQKYEIIISRFAENDLKEIVNYFLEINPEYAKTLFLKIKSKILELKEFPERGKIVPELEQQGIIKYRQILEGNYRIIYSIKKLEVNILVIVDSRRELEKVLMIKLTEISEE
jgi:toxin ParE1/3/4